MYGTGGEAPAAPSAASRQREGIAPSATERSRARRGPVLGLERLRLKTEPSAQPSCVWPGGPGAGKSRGGQQQGAVAVPRGRWVGSPLRFLLSPVWFSPVSRFSPVGFLTALRPAQVNHLSAAYLPLQKLC